MSRIAWSEDELSAVLEQLEVDPSRKYGRRPFPFSPHGETEEGRQELPVAEIERFDIAGVDFTGSRSPKNEHGVDSLLQVKSCRCRDVVFDRCGRFHRLEGIFDDCSFERIAVAGCAFTGVYRRCCFTRVNFRDGSLLGDFDECRFIDCDLRVDSWRGSFQNCTFENCRVEDLFADIQELLESTGPITFSVPLTGKLQVGEFNRSSRDHTLDSIPWEVRDDGS